jgi:hypothetical protein
MTTAMATTEHRSSGAIGQPAACMIENNNPDLSATGGFWDARLWPEHTRCDAQNSAPELSPSVLAAGLTRQLSQQSTVAVDNFVGNLAVLSPRPRKCKAWNGLLKS